MFSNKPDVANAAKSRRNLDAWPMVEASMRQRLASRSQSPDIDEQARRRAAEVEARTGLPRAQGSASSRGHELARALADAGYMPLADYVALYGGATTPQDSRQRDAQAKFPVVGRFSQPFPRRQAYRVTSIRCTFAKLKSRPVRTKRRA